MRGVGAMRGESGREVAACWATIGVLTGAAGATASTLGTQRLTGGRLQIIDMSTSKTGKHGHAKVHLVATDVRI